jgi:hypothetical protein
MTWLMIQSIMCVREFADLHGEVWGLEWMVGIVGGRLLLYIWCPVFVWLSMYTLCVTYATKDTWGDGIVLGWVDIGATRK